MITIYKYEKERGNGGKQHGEKLNLVERNTYENPKGVTYKGKPTLSNEHKRRGVGSHQMPPRVPFIIPLFLEEVMLLIPQDRAILSGEIEGGMLRDREHLLLRRASGGLSGTSPSPIVFLLMSLRY
jgi:hypothetical protein